MWTRFRKLKKTKRQRLSTVTKMTLGDMLIVFTLPYGAGTRPITVANMKTLRAAAINGNKYWKRDRIIKANEEARQRRRRGKLEFTII